MKYYFNGGVPPAMHGWPAIYAGPGGGNDLAADVTSILDPLSPLADVFITGGSLGSGSGDDIATVKYRQMDP